MIFHSPLPFREPDGTYYARLKHITVVDHQPAKALGSCGLSQSFPAVRELVGEEAYDQFYGPRLALAAQNLLGHDFTARFPGTHVPDLGNNGRLISVGSLAFDRFLRVASWQGGVLEDGLSEVYTLEPTLCAVDWPWSVSEPELRTIVPASIRQVVEDHRLQTFRQELLQSSDPLRVIEQAWSPRTQSLGRADMRTMAQDTLRGRRHTNLPFLFELEDVLACARWMNGRVCVGRGLYRGCYLEVYLQKLSAIRNTELTQTPRVLQELCSLVERGFAPIVVNEYGANVDGTHRQTACWIWNLMHGLEVTDLNVHDTGLQQHVRRFVSIHADQMGPVTLREVLRIFAEFVLSPESCNVLARKILPAQRQYPRVTHVPVLFLREKSWPTVRYREYLGGERAVRVDPLVYQAMDDDASLVLPAHGQGPYHLTDRELVYWFDVLAINRDR